MQKIEILFKEKGIDNPEKERKAKMSNQTSMPKQSIAKPFCKVCHDAGKTVAEYSTHYVRESRGGAVVCPTILNQQCNYCKKHGHTPSHCPELQAKQVQAKQVQSKQVQAQARLCELPRMENKISAPVIKPVALKMKSWASVVSKKPAQEEPEEPEEQAQAQEPEAQEPEAQEPEAQEPEAQAQRAQEPQAQEPEEPEEQAPEEQAQEEPEEQAQRVQAQEQAQRVQAQAPAFNYSNMAWADVE